MFSMDNQSVVSIGRSGLVIKTNLTTDSESVRSPCKDIISDCQIISKEIGEGNPANNNEISNPTQGQIRHRDVTRLLS